MWKWTELHLYICYAEVGYFFACPEIPVPAHTFDVFINHLCEGLGDDEGNLGRRIHALRPAYEIKWACIVLNDFLIQDERRRNFSGQEGRQERCALMLERAQNLVARARKLRGSGAFPYSK